MKPVALQLCALASEAETRLERSVRRVVLDAAALSAFADSTVDAQTARLIITSGGIGCPQHLMESLPDLRMIAIHGVGFDRIDLNECALRSICVANTPNALTADVADLAVGMTIGLLRRIPQADLFVRRGEWPRGDFPLTRRVSGRRFGIVGLGRIGMAIGHRLEPFGEVAYHSPSARQVSWRAYPDIPSLARDSDVLILACAATPDTHHIVDHKVMQALGSEGCLINVGRGSLVDEPALVEALDSGVIAGFASDVFASEPDIPGSLLASHRTLLAPHVGSATKEARIAMGLAVCENVEQFLQGQRPSGALPIRSN